MNELKLRIVPERDETPATRSQRIEWYALELVSAGWTAAAAVIRAEGLFDELHRRGHLTEGNDACTPEHPEIPRG